MNQSIATNRTVKEAKGKLLLIGFADALSAPEVAWNLLDAGFRVAAFVRRTQRPALRRCKSIVLFDVTPPELDAEATVSEIKALYMKLGAAAVMPLNDKAVWLCSRLASEPGIAVAGTIGQQAQLALDKRLQIKAALEEGFHVPRTTIISHEDDIPSDLAYPVVMKPALAVSEHNGRLQEKKSASFFANNEEFQKGLRKWDKTQPQLVQSVHKGVGEGLFGFGSCRGIEAWSAHQRLRMMNPKGSGSSACRAVAADIQLVERAERLMRKIDWRGMFMFELLRDETGVPWFIEINGRPWGSMCLALRMGFDYPVWTALQALEPDYCPPELTQDREQITCRHLGREIAHLLYVLRGPTSKAIPQWPSMGATLKALFHFGRNERWYNWNSDNKSLFFEDTYNTLRSEIFQKLFKKRA